MVNNAKAWWMLLFIQSTMVALVLGAYFGMKSNIIAMKDELHLMILRVQVLDERLTKMETASVRQPVAGAASASAQVLMPSPAPVASGTSVAPDGSSKLDSPICVNKMTHSVIPCDKANRCLGSNNFNGDYFNKLRLKLKIADSDVMMICDEKIVEGNDAPDMKGPHSAAETPAPSDVKAAAEPATQKPSPEYGL